jgi:hypothetical protein
MTVVQVVPLSAHSTTLLIPNLRYTLSSHSARNVFSLARRTANSRSLTSETLLRSIITPTDSNALPIFPSLNHLLAHNRARILQRSGAHVIRQLKIVTTTIAQIPHEHVTFTHYPGWTSIVAILAYSFTAPPDF